MPDWVQPLGPNRRPGRVGQPEQQGPGVTFERAVELFAEQYVSPKSGRPFSRTSKKNVRDNLLGGPLTAFRKQHGVDTVDAWNGDLAVDYLNWLQHELRRDSATIKKVRGQMRSFGRFCDEHFHTTNAAAGGLASMRVTTTANFERHKDPPLTHGEADRLLKAASSPRDRLAVAMLLYTGMRPAELLALEDRHTHVDRKPPIVEVRGSVHDPGGSESDAGFRDVPLTIGQNLLPRLIRAHLTDPRRPPAASRLFLSHRADHRGRHEPLSADGLKSMLAALGDTTGIKCNAYRLRHTFCTWCAQAGVEMLHLQLLLGLASSDMVSCYYRDRTSEAVLEAAARVRF